MIRPTRAGEAELISFAARARLGAGRRAARAAASSAARLACLIASNTSSRNTVASGGNVKPSLTALPRTSTTRTSMEWLTITASPGLRIR